MARHKKLEAVEDEDPKLDISSLIDVCFLLLIYFIVATSLVQERKLDMSMPGQSVGENASQIEPALIRIIKDGTIYWGKDNSLMIDNDMNNHNLATLAAGSQKTGGQRCRHQAGSAVVGGRGCSPPARY